MPSAENCTAYRFHKEIDQGTQNALAFCPPKVSDAVSLTAYLLYQTVFHLSRTFFVLFKPLFSLTAAPLSDSFNRIPQHSPSCQQKFSGFFIFRNRDITPITSKVRKSILFMRQTPSRSPPWPVSVSQSHLSQPRFSLFS